MKNTVLVIFLFMLCSGSVSGQNIRLYASPKGAEVLDKNGDTLLNPWCGGWANPEFSNIDLNNDGRQDLFVFLPGNGDNRVLTFLNIGNGQYQYYPEYESYFPPLQYWALLRDYNHDGKPDIFTYAREGGAIDVWKNVSDSTGIKFSRVTSSADVNKDYMCYIDAGNDTVNIFVTNSGVPAISDFDGDGDLDILSFDPTQYTAFYYQNMAVEKGYSLDSIHFNFSNPTMCWGKFATTFSIQDPVTLGIGCGRAMAKNAHGASSLLAVDMDNDGDMDLLYGNLFGSQVVQMNNARITGGKVKYRHDTMSTKDSLAVGANKKVNMSVYPVPFLADGNGDNIPDIIVAPMDAANDTPNHKTYLYRNNGGSGNHFDFITDNFLQETMLDEGEHAAPAFVDYNGDGLTDMVLATRANLYGGYSYDHLELFRNIGTAKKAVYEKEDNDFASLARWQLAYLAPAFADIDGDGRPDMLLGRADGKVMYYKNLADSGKSLKMKLITADMPKVSCSGYSAPCLAHISSDSLFDIVMGKDSGNFSYYKNTGTATNPVFKKMTDNFGRVRVNTYYWGNYKYDNQGNIIDSTYLMQWAGRSAPVIADLDHDGKPDMISGSYYGEMFFWFDIKSHLKDTFVRTDTVFYNTLKNQKENKFLGLFTMPAATDMDGDGYPDMLIGNNMGGILYYGSQVVKLGIADSRPVGYDEAQFKVFPNPSHDIINIWFDAPGHGQAGISITDMLGRQVYHAPWQRGVQVSEVDVSSFEAGVYFVKMQDSDGRTGVRKIIIK